jgi:hypothetical protein
VELALLKNL